MKSLKITIILLACLVAGLGAGKVAAPLIADWTAPPREVDGDYSEYVRASGKPLVLFSTTTCPYCKAAREYLDERRIAYRDYVIDRSPEAMSLYRKLDEQGVPVILTAKRKIRGFNPHSLDGELEAAGLKRR